MNYRYHYCGLILESEMPLPELETDSSGHSTNILIRKNRLDQVRIPREIARRGPNWAVGCQESWWWLGDRIRFRIRKHLIDIEATGADEAFVRALLLEAPMVLAMIYQGEFCLNASAAMVGEKAVVFCGAPGSGRSTAVVRLSQSGHKLVCDSLARITISDSGIARVWPQGSGFLLWPHSLELLGLGSDTGRKVRTQISLRRCAISTIRQPATVEQIYWGNAYDGSYQYDDDSTFSPSASRRFTRFSVETAGRMWIEPAGQNVAHFSWCHRLARACGLQKAPETYFNWTSDKKSSRESLDSNGG